MNKIFISVNYGTSNIIKQWITSIENFNNNQQIIIVDNFHSDIERLKVKQLSSELKFTLIESTNVGYGRALKVAFEYIKKKYSKLNDCVIFAGNLDIQFMCTEAKYLDGNIVYVPIALEGKRNRNPFLTHLQKKLLKLHLISIQSESLPLFIIVIFLIKLAGYVPSKIWALHGSLFVFNASILNHGVIFNEKSFLYSEELEFASFIENLSNSKIRNSKIEYKHFAHVATCALVSTRKIFYKLWKPSFTNWLNRWEKR